MKEYDIRSIFEQMELELIASMKRNLSRHQKWESDEGMNWTMWQVEQLKTLEEFKKNNQKIFTKKFTSVNNEIAKFLESNYKTNGFNQEKSILQMIAYGKASKKDIKIKEEWFNIPLDKRKDFNIKDFIITSNTKGLEGAFFSFNEDKMNALIKATTKDMSKAEHAMLRMVDDQYRKTIYKAQVMANSGAFTLQQSIDMATKDFLKAGINCIEYKDGRRVNIASYAEMNIRTATKRAKLISEGEARKAYGIHTVRISRYGQCSETCLPWQGKVYVDDVYSGGTKEEAERLNLPLLSTAIAGGLFHPNCKHTMTTYFYDLKKSLGKLHEDGVENPPEEQEHRKNQKHIQQQERIATGSLDPLNIAQAEQKKAMWEEQDRKLGYEHDDWLSFKFENKIETINHSDEVVDEYYKSLSVFSFNNKLKQMVKDDIRHMPINDLEFIKSNKIKIFSSNKASYYGSLFNDRIKFIVLNKEKIKPGTFAHEFAHYVAESVDLYNDKEFSKVLENVRKSITSYEYKMYPEGKYVVLKSPLFVRPYQGRTYITKEQFEMDKRVSVEDLVEYISVGYETFISNPLSLYKKDKILYDYLKEKGLRK